MYTSARSTSFSASVNDKMSEQDGTNTESNPIQIAVISGKQEIKLKTKQNDTLHGPKVRTLDKHAIVHIYCLD